MLFTSGVVGLLSNLEISRYLEIVHFQSRILEIEKTRDFRNTNLGSFLEFFDFLEPEVLKP